MAGWPSGFKGQTALWPESTRFGVLLFKEQMGCRGLAPGWRLNRDAHVDLHFIDGERRIVVRAHFRPTGFPDFFYNLRIPCAGK